MIALVTSATAYPVKYGVVIEAVEAVETIDVALGLRNNGMDVSKVYPEIQRYELVNLMKMSGFAQ